jgi:hypothetical protein
LACEPQKQESRCTHAHYQDVTCSFRGRRNREVRLVANSARLVICQVCLITRCTEIARTDSDWTQLGVRNPPSVCRKVRRWLP